MAKRKCPRYFTKTWTKFDDGGGSDGPRNLSFMIEGKRHCPGCFKYLPYPHAFGCPNCNVWMCTYCRRERDEDNFCPDCSTTES
jgi:hypothetical protein